MAPIYGERSVSTRPAPVANEPQCQEEDTTWLPMLCGTTGQWVEGGQRKGRIGPGKRQMQCQVLLPYPMLPHGPAT